MRRLSPIRHVAFCAAALASSTVSAQAIINGGASTLGVHMVQIVGPKGTPNCSGVALDRTHIVTARHCSVRAILADGARIRPKRIAQKAVLDDGKHVTVSGDVILITLQSPLPASVTPMRIGEQEGEGNFTIAGFGAVAEAKRGKLGPLHEATVILHVPFRLVDPKRDGELSASACYGDSGGAVIRNGSLVGIITRASHPHPKRVCGHLTHYAPVVATGGAPVSANGAQSAAALVVPPRKFARRNKGKRIVTRR